MLVFGTEIKCKWSCYRPCRHPCDCVYTLTEGPAKVVRYCLGEMKIVRQWLAAHEISASVHFFDSRIWFRFLATQFWSKLPRQHVHCFCGEILCINVHCFFGFGDQACTFSPSPRPHAILGAANVTKRRQLVKRWIDPTVDRNVRCASLRPLNRWRSG